MYHKLIITWLIYHLLFIDGISVDRGSQQLVIIVGDADGSGGVLRCHDGVGYM